MLRRVEHDGCAFTAWELSSSSVNAEVVILLRQPQRRFRAVGAEARVFRLELTDEDGQVSFIATRWVCVFGNTLE